jgi:hypothetical protein
MNDWRKCFWMVERGVAELLEGGVEIVSLHLGTSYWVISNPSFGEVRAAVFYSSMVGTY